MEDLAASLMPYPHSAPLYLLYGATSIANATHGPPPPGFGNGDDNDDDGFEFATTTTTTLRNFGGGKALRACASDVSAAAFADELLRAGALLPLSLPPRLYSAGASAATSPLQPAASTTSRGRKHRGFDPFAAALEKVRRDGGGAPAIRRARSLSPPRGAAAAVATNGSDASAAAAARRARKRKGRGGVVRHLLCRLLVATAAAAPRALWPRARKDGGAAYRPGLLVCLGYGV